ncbi:MAG: recombination mediator RecR [Alphaproteobacteria bacterium]|nr:recombination mediator RecR [Alphaproteobacteria bacterium]
MSAPEIETLIALLSKLPTLGPRSARRAVLHLLNRKESQFVPLIAALQEVADKIKPCAVCGNMDTSDPCSICRDERRGKAQICVVQDVADLWALERAGMYRGRYHVLGGVLSALDGVGPDELKIPALVERVAAGGIAEIILALPATIEGQTTAHYVADKLADFPVQISTLSRGVPMGGELDYLDDGTLQLAFSARKKIGG